MKLFEMFLAALGLIVAVGFVAMIAVIYPVIIRAILGL